MISRKIFLAPDNSTEESDLQATVATVTFQNGSKIQAYLKKKSITAYLHVILDNR